MIKKTPVKGTKTVKVTFTLPKDRPGTKVSVVGDFNGWNPLSHPLRPRSNGTRSVQVPLPAGQRYAFRYLGEGGQWLNDETATELEGDNSVLHT